MWIVIETTNPLDDRYRRGDKTQCQYLTDMLEAVKAAAVKPDVVFISIEKEEN